MIKKIGFYLLSTCLFLSCSDKEYDSIAEEIEITHPAEEEKTLPIKLAMDKSSENFYNMVMFELQDSTYVGPNGSILIPLKYQTLDSLTWEVEGSKNKVNLLDKNANGFRFTTSWGHYFYLPGHYKTYLRGYRGTEVVVTDSAAINISGHGDFLHIKWNEVKGEATANTGYTNNGTEDYEFRLFSSQIGDLVFSKLNVRFDQFNYMKYNPEIGEREIALFTTYISSLYGQPKFDKKSKVMFKEFKKLFKRSAKEDQVVKIWIGKTSNIALLKKETFLENGFGYEIHAEPKL